MPLPFTPVTTAPALPEVIAPPVPRLSFDEAFAECASFVWRVVSGLGVREADVEDVCPEVFLVVHRRLATFNGQSTVRTWVYGICIRVASDYRRRPHHARERALDEAKERFAPADQHTDLEKRRALAWLDRVLDTLDDPKRAVFVLHEIELVPMVEVASAVGCPLNTAYGRLYAARKHVEAAARREQARRSPA
jgi:RNA polymerase sigma-70 factor (ECF subfamily)